MIELENKIVPVLQEYKYGILMIPYLTKIGTINYIITIVNNFDPSITFTDEVEKDCYLSFPNVL